MFHFSCMSRPLQSMARARIHMDRHPASALRHLPSPEPHRPGEGLPHKRVHSTRGSRTGAREPRGRGLSRGARAKAPWATRARARRRTSTLTGSTALRSGI